MRRLLIGVLPLAIFAAIAGFLWRGLSLDPSELPSPLIDRPAPEFRVGTLDPAQGEFDSASLDGRVWVLNVWASWCGPCVQEHPQIAALAATRDVPVIGLNYKDDPDDARAWLDRHGDVFSEVLSDVDGAVGLDWGVYGVPETFIVGHDGRVRHKHVGPVLPEDLEGSILPQLDAALEGAPS